MRVDRNNPRQHCEDLVDWLRRHPLWIINVLLGYAFYLATAERI